MKEAKDDRAGTEEETTMRKFHDGKSRIGDVKAGRSGAFSPYRSADSSGQKLSGMRRAKLNSLLDSESMDSLRQLDAIRFTGRRGGSSGSHQGRA